jgi:rubrerythrin
MKDLKGTKTEANLKAAFAGESQAHTKYRYYSDVAAKEGHKEFSDLFLETAKNESEHAELWFKYLHGGALPTTEANLNDAATGEHYECTEMYPEFAKVAREEGFPEIAAKFEMVGKIESRHEARYKAMLDQLKTDKVVLKAGVVVVWKCQVCGHIHVGPVAPKVCPVCGHTNTFLPEPINYDWKA